MEEQRDDEPEETPGSAIESGGPPWMRRKRRRVVRRVGGHVEPRASFGLLTLSTLGFSAAVLLIAIATVGAVVYVAQGRPLHAIVFFLAGLALAIVAGGFGFGMGFIGLPIAGDWFLEWPNHAIGWSIGVAGCALLAALLFLTPLPAWAGVILTLATVFGAGYVFGYVLRTTKPVTAGPHPQGGQH
ncbi:MAG: hypothetical protein ABR978_01920 [Dehalococcoidia bacterium]